MTSDSEYKYQGEKLPEFTTRVLAFFRHVLDCNDLFWYEGDDGIIFCVNCNDQFYWGCADAEDITPQNFHLLQTSYDDLHKISEGIEGNKKGFVYSGIVLELFCARSRGQRPQGAAYPDEEIYWSLFDACGEAREVGFGNPYHNRKAYKEAMEKRL